MNFRNSCDGECGCEHKTEKQCAETENLNNQKPISFSYCLKSDIEQIFPSGCYHCFEAGCLKYFVREKQDLIIKSGIFLTKQQ